MNPVRHLSWSEITQKAWGKDWTKPDLAYEFTGGRKFNDRGRALSGDGITDTLNLSLYADDYSTDYA